MKAVRRHGCRGGMGRRRGKGRVGQGHGGRSLVSKVKQRPVQVVYCSCSEQLRLKRRKDDNRDASDPAARRLLRSFAFLMGCSVGTNRKMDSFAPTAY